LQGTLFVAFLIDVHGHHRTTDTIETQKNVKGTLPQRVIEGDDGYPPTFHLHYKKFDNMLNNRVWHIEQYFCGG
jgi:hypothetical protein